MELVIVFCAIFGCFLTFIGLIEDALMFALSGALLIFVSILCGTYLYNVDYEWERDRLTAENIDGGLKVSFQDCKHKPLSTVTDCEMTKGWVINDTELLAFAKSNGKELK